MVINAKAYVKIMGVLSIIAGFSMVFPLITGIVYKEESSINAFGDTIGASLLFGIFLVILSRKVKGTGVLPT